MKEREELLRVKRRTSEITKTANPILLGLRYMLASHLFQPAGRLLCSFEIEKTGIQYLTNVYLTLRNRNDFGVSVKGSEYCLEATNIFAASQIGLADQDDIGKFHLID